MLTIDLQNKSSLKASNQLLALLTELIGRAFIEKSYFQNAQIPMTTLIYLANDLIKSLDKKEQPEKLSLAKELKISYKQWMGYELTKEEKKYDNQIHELDVAQEIMKGVKYATSFSIVKNLYNSVSSTITQGLSEHIPAIIGSATAMTVAPYLLSKAIEKVLAKTKLTTEQKEIIKPWLNTLGRLILAFTPKVEANESGVNYQYPSTEGHRELFKKINISVMQNGKNLLSDKTDAEFLKENIEFKLKRIQVGENNSVEVIGMDKNDEEVKFNFSEHHSDKLALSPSLRVTAKQTSSSLVNNIIDTAYNYLPTQYSLTNAIIAFGTQKILLQQSPASFLPLLMASTLFLKPIKAQGIGAIGNEFLVNTNITNNQEYHKIAKLNDGGFVVTWMSCDQDGSLLGVYGKRYTSGGNELATPTSGVNTAVGNEFRVNSYTVNSQAYPVISSLSDGGFVVAWGSNGQDVGGTNGIYGKRFTVNGTELALPTSGINTAVGNEFRINSYTANNQLYPAISGLPDGGFVVVWYSIIQDVGGTNGIYGKRFAVNGAELALPTSGINTAVGNEFRINSYTANNQFKPVISSLPDGGFVVAWYSVGQDVGGTIGIYGKRFAVNGAELALPTSGINTAVGNEFRVNSYTANSQYYPAISNLLDGGFTVVWVACQDVGGTNGIYGKRFAVNGTELALPTSGINTAVGNEFRVNSYTANSQSLPVIASLTDGGFIVVWGSIVQDVGGTNGIYGKRFAVNGAELALPTSGINTAVGNEFRVNSDTTNNQGLPAISSLLDGGFIVVWGSYNQTGMMCDGFGKRYAANGTEVPLQTNTTTTLPVSTTTKSTTINTTSNSQTTSNTAITTTTLSTTASNSTTSVVASTQTSSTASQTSITPSSTQLSTLTSVPTKTTQTATQFVNNASSNNITIPLVACIIGGCVIITDIGLETFFAARQIRKNKEKNLDLKQNNELEIFSQSSKQNGYNSRLKSSTNIASQSSFFKNSDTSANQTKSNDYHAMSKNTLRVMQEKEGGRQYVNAPK